MRAKIFPSSLFAVVAGVGLVFSIPANGYGRAFGASPSAFQITEVPTIASSPSPAVTPSPTLVVTETLQPSPDATPTVSGTSSSGATTKLDMNAIFPPGDGRDLVLDNCTACHTFVRFVTGQRDDAAWDFVRRDMRPRVASLSDADVDRIFAYLRGTFNAIKPVPDLPDWLQEAY